MLESNSEMSEQAENQLLLFTSGNAPRSQRARNNLARALERLGLADVEVHEIDLLGSPRTGIRYSVFAAPALMVFTEDGEQQLLYGDLAEGDKLDAILATLQER